jgi:hypothetical protein
MRLRSVMSRVTASRARTSPCAPRSGTAWVSSHSLRPRSPSASNSRMPDCLSNTLVLSASKAARYSASTKLASGLPTTWEASASSMARPAGFISRTRPSRSRSFTHSGSFSMTARSRAWLSRSVSSARLRSVMSSNTITAPTMRSPSNIGVDVYAAAKEVPSLRQNTSLSTWRTLPSRSESRIGHSSAGNGVPSPWLWCHNG